MTASGAGGVVLVTGASGGVGRGIAIDCGAAGWSVWVAARRHVDADDPLGPPQAAAGDRAEPDHPGAEHDGG